MARLAIAKGFLGEYAKLDKDVRPTAEPAGQNPQLPFAALRTFLVLDADVRHRIEVLNVDRLAYHVVKQARGTPSSRTSGCCATAGPRLSRRPGWPSPRRSAAGVCSRLAQSRSQGASSPILA